MTRWARLRIEVEEVDGWMIALQQCGSKRGLRCSCRLARRRMEMADPSLDGLDRDGQTNRSDGACGRKGIFIENAMVWYGVVLYSTYSTGI